MEELEKKTEQIEPEEEHYVLSPKGCAAVALSQVGICEMDDSRIEPFWILFTHYMRNCGYITEE